MMGKLLMLTLLMMSLLIFNEENDLDKYIKAEFVNCQCSGEIIIIVPSDSPQFDFNQIPKIFSSRRIIRIVEEERFKNQKDSFIVHDKKLVAFLVELMNSKGPFLIEYNNGHSKMILDLSKINVK